MKTYEVSKFIAFSATVHKKRCVIVRDEKALIRESILNEIWARYDTANRDGHLDGAFVKNEHDLKDKQSGKTLVYTKGFRASDNSKRANLKGASDIDIAIIEEGEDINDPMKYNTFVDSLRKQGCIVIIMLNTPDISHFISKRYFTFENVPILDSEGNFQYDEYGERLVEDGYFKLIPKKLPGFVCIQTNYTDNNFLPEHIIYNYEQYGNPSSPTYDKHYFLTAIKGYSSSGRKGQIFTKCKPYSIKDYHNLTLKEYFGQDFGTAAPAAFGGAKFDKNRVYARLINYEPKEVLELGKMYCNLKLTKNDRIICDHAEPDTILQLSRGWPASKLDKEILAKYPQLVHGFYAVPCGPKDIEAHIGIMKGLELYIVNDNECGEAAWEEVAKYVYNVNKSGEYTNDPKDGFNHFWDQLRYVIIDHYGNKAAPAKKLY
jgi:phage terminase large subunit